MYGDHNHTGTGSFSLIKEDIVQRSLALFALFHLKRCLDDIFKWGLVRNQCKFIKQGFIAHFNFFYFYLKGGINENLSNSMKIMKIDLISFKGRVEVIENDGLFFDIEVVLQFTKLIDELYLELFRSLGSTWHINQYYYYLHEL